MQNVICAIRNCGYNSPSGFCLNRLVSIGPQGACSWLGKAGWDQKIEDQFKSGYRYWEKEQEKEEEERVTLSEVLKGAGAGSAENETKTQEENEDATEKNRGQGSN